MAGDWSRDGLSAADRRLLGLRGGRQAEKLLQQGLSLRRCRPPEHLARHRQHDAQRRRNPERAPEPTDTHETGPVRTLTRSAPSARALRAAWRRWREVMEGRKAFSPLPSYAPRWKTSRESIWFNSIKSVRSGTFDHVHARGRRWSTAYCSKTDRVQLPELRLICHAGGPESAVRRRLALSCDLLRRGDWNCGGVSTTIGSLAASGACSNGTAMIASGAGMASGWIAGETSPGRSIDPSWGMGGNPPCTAAGVIAGI